MNRWYAVYTRSNCEKKVAAELAERGMEHYLPLLAERRQWTDRKKLVTFPLFPNYLFVRLPDLASQSVPILTLSGVVALVGSGQKPEPVPDDEILGVRLMLNSGEQCFRHPLLRNGTRVRVRRGPLKNLEGILVRVKNQMRLVVSLILLCQSVAAEIDIRDVEPLL